MNRIPIDVPVGIKYISDWKEFELPETQCIMNKVVCGCGFTEAVLRNRIPTVLCSPRKLLLQNKYEQHKDENMYLVINSGEKIVITDVDPSIRSSEGRDPIGTQPKEDPTEILSLIDQIKAYVISSGHGTFFTPKILVTYDSFKHVVKALTDLGPGYLDWFHVVVDEFQSIFTDASFKAEVELDFVEYLKPLRKVTYLSATPMIESYLDRIEEFSSLPYYELRWPPEMISKPVITRVKVKSVNEAILGVIKQYKNGQFPQKVTGDGVLHLSKEVVFYVNSVNSICQVIKKAGLDPSETNVICSNSPKNIQRLHKCRHDLGSIPLKGEPHKMFTFCTRTSYLGADFYSECASTVICSDVNIKCLAIDISLDLPQILGRQRLAGNVFKDSAIIYYRLLSPERDFTKENFDKMVARKSKITNKVVEKIVFDDSDTQANTLLTYRSAVYLRRYSEDYTGVSDKTGKLVFNKLVLLSEQRAWEISQKEYRDDVSVLAHLEEVCNVKEINDEVTKFLVALSGFTRFSDAYQYLCEYNFPSTFIRALCLDRIQPEMSNFFNILGPKRSRAIGYKRKDLQAEYSKILNTRETNSNSSEDSLKSEILSSFTVGERYQMSYIKTTLQGIYDKLGVPEKAKATDLGNWFSVKPCLIPANGRREHGLEILGTL